MSADPFRSMLGATVLHAWNRRKRREHLQRSSNNRKRSPGHRLQAIPLANGRVRFIRHIPLHR